MQLIEKTKHQGKTVLSYQGSHNFFIISTLSIVQSLRNFKNHPCSERLNKNWNNLIEKGEQVADYYILNLEYSEFKTLLQKLQKNPSKKLERLKLRELRIISISFRCILITICSKMPDEILTGSIKFKKSFYYSILNSISSLLGISFVIQESSSVESEPDEKLEDFQNNLIFFEAPFNESPVINLRVDLNMLYFYLFTTNDQSDYLNKQERFLKIEKSLKEKKKIKRVEKDHQAEIITHRF
jgi:hypothetical protein